MRDLVIHQSKVNQLRSSQSETTAQNVMHSKVTWVRTAQYMSQSNESTQIRHTVCKQRHVGFTIKDLPMNGAQEALKVAVQFNADLDAGM